MSELDTASALIGKALVGLSMMGGIKEKGSDTRYRQNAFYPVRNRDAVNFFNINALPICFVRAITPLDGVRISATSDTVVDHETVDFVLGWTDKVWYEPDSFLSVTTGSIDDTMVTWDKFYEYVLPSVQGCPVSIVNNAIRSACIEFCEKTLLWKQDSIVNDIVEGFDLYLFAPPPNAKVVMPYRVSINGVEVQPTDLQTLESFMPHWKEAKDSLPKYYFLANDDVVRLVGTPTETIPNALTADVALKPSRDAKSCPTFIYDDWAETIAAGALAKLHAMKGKVWAMPEMVSYYTKLFREGVSRARSKAAKSWLQESKQMLPVGFYNEKRYF